MGSPSRTRGILLVEAVHRENVGLTPAYAGNTKHSWPSRPTPWAHPRVRGEYYSYAALTCLSMGSPPRTRGIRHQQGGVPRLVRLTPAYAGNTCHQDCSKRARQAHPRVRGEYFTSITRIPSFGGSPPRTRGIRQSAACGFGADGLTPAYAGNTLIF